MNFSGSRLGNQEHTRCIGNYLVKGGYKDFEELSLAVAEPVIAEPEVHGGIVLDETCSFLLLMSDGLYKSLQEATGCMDTVNKEIAQMTVEQVSKTLLLGILTILFYWFSHSIRKHAIEGDFKFNDIKIK